MIKRRPAEARGHMDHGWLDTYHTFSFGTYHDPDQMGFRALRVINEDRVQPGKGFQTHAHWDMEILTVVLEGALEHKDSLGTGSVIHAGEVQRMTAGSGITHSEFNHSPDELVHFLQVWILPERQALEPSYEQHAFPAEERRGRLRLIASHDGRDDSLTVQQDVSVFDGMPEPGGRLTHDLAAGRHAWVQVLRGNIELDDVALSAGDGAAVSDVPRLTLRAASPAELLLFDLA